MHEDRAMPLLPQPRHTYLNTAAQCHDAQSIVGDLRVIEHAERTGINTRTIHGGVALREHTLHAPRGSATLWVLGLEDLGVAGQYPAQHRRLPAAHVYPLLSDHPAPQFALDHCALLVAIESYWHPQFYAKWTRGSFYRAYQPEQRAAIPVSHFRLQRHQWYQIVVTWDEPAGDYRLYVNGILVGTSDRNAHHLQRDPLGPVAYVGNPALCVSEVCFYDVVLDAAAIASSFADGQTQPNPVLQEQLHAIYVGQSQPFGWQRDATWQQQLALRFTQSADLEQCYVQGNREAPQITTEGLRITTPPVYYPHAPMPDLPNRRHVYVWTRRTFEGDLYVSYDFKPLAPGGLSLLMTNCSGMQREDFMRDYPPEDTDDMAYLYGQDVRNYHWEYWRDMNDVRNDCASHALIKNPYFHPLVYACRPERLAIGAWHRLEYLQEAAHIRCVINGDVVLDVHDAPFTNNGPIYNFGHVAIRCMVTTDLLVRDLEVWTRPVIG
jgi:hypothetical protein